jgi:hypothetical protein
MWAGLDVRSSIRVNTSIREGLGDSYRLNIMKKRIATFVVVEILAAVTVFVSLTHTSRAPSSDVTALNQRIKHLEQIVARLEQRGTATTQKTVEYLAHAKFTPDGKTLVTQAGQSTSILQVPPHVPQGGKSSLQPLPNARTSEMPSGSRPFEFNGVTYYVIPLASTPKQNGEVTLTK